MKAGGVETTGTAVLIPGVVTTAVAVDVVVGDDNGDIRNPPEDGGVMFIIVGRRGEHGGDSNTVIFLSLDVGFMMCS